MPFIDFRADPGGGEYLRSVIPAEDALARAQVIAGLVAVAASHSPVRVSCLHRSLVLWGLLRRHGIPCEIRLGACTESGPFEAHAWVQCAGVALNGHPDDLSRYSSFAVAVVPVGRRWPWPLVTRRV